jgi:hypothetical protein
MSVAEADPESWAVGFLDECWWSRVALPALNSFSEKSKPLRLVQRSVAKDDPEPKAVSCYGLYLPGLDETWLRFVDGRPISSITTRFLSWCAEKLKAAGKKAVVLIWDNASWHVSKEVRRWLGSHNRGVKESGEGVRIVSSLLPKQSPWLNAIEPKWRPKWYQSGIKRLPLIHSRSLSPTSVLSVISASSECEGTPYRWIVTFTG